MRDAALQAAGVCPSPSRLSIVRRMTKGFESDRGGKEKANGKGNGKNKGKGKGNRKGKGKEKGTGKRAGGRRNRQTEKPTWLKLMNIVSALVGMYMIFVSERDIYASPLPPCWCSHVSAFACGFLVASARL
eukprot:SAG11_NODE_658_length_7897_cov_13.075789_1_plen_131_part_00